MGETMTTDGDRILVVEDDRGSRDALAALLRDCGYVVDTAADGVEALDKVRREPPALVISDVQMPRSDGFHFVAALRELAAAADVAVIVVSGLAAPERRAAGLDLGADDFLAKPLDPNELLARVRAHLRHVHRHENLVRRALLDPLTGVLNRRGILSVLRREQARARRTGMPLCVLMLDVNDFKALNDTHGHAAGDTALRRLAHELVRSVRIADHVGRLGGDEFVLVLPDTDERAADRLAARLTSLQPVSLTGATSVDVGVSVSVGRATLQDDEDLDALLGRADQEMYRSKRSSKTMQTHMRTGGAP